MPVQVAGFAEALVRCQDFRGVEAQTLESALAKSDEPLQMQYADPSAELPLIRSGSEFSHLVFVQHGTVVPWQFPHSELGAPFLIGEHELLMDAERWVASYSAVSPSVVVRIPKRLMTQVLEDIPGVRGRMHELVMRRQSRFYWISLATSGTPRSRVAAALVSRLALEDRDFGVDRVIEVRQKDIGRLTTMSRSAVAAGFAELAEAKAIRWGAEPGARFTGEVLVPDVELLKEHAFLDVREREIQPLLGDEEDE
ncbi:MAG: Crp/Fnr family transcriptional regulator [Chloroflexi bacterium]|nr:Crp/Fnr family transcriptional regulator [Chloroflexota bacterium]